MTHSNKRLLSVFLNALIILSLVLGVFLRIRWNPDMEFKSDEKLMFEQSLRISRGEDFPLLGMPSGVEIPNPGLSVWLFGGLAKISYAEEPLRLNFMVEIVNILALLGLLLFILRQVSVGHQEVWIWAFAWICVNPIAVLFSRKIWAQDLLPLFCVAFLFSITHLRSKKGAFGVGLFTVLIGQIHMSGFFLGASVLLWLALLNRKTLKQWLPSLALGAGIAMIPLLPWLGQFFEHSRAVERVPWRSLVEMSYWRQGIGNAIGIGLQTSLADRLGVMGSIQNLTLFLMLFLFFQVILRSIRQKAFHEILFPQKEYLYHAYGGAIIVAMGILLTLARIPIQKHYLIVTFPVFSVWICHLWLRFSFRPRTFLLILWIFQLSTSLLFQSYIHDHCGAPHGDYGVAYRCQ